MYKIVIIIIIIIIIVIIIIIIIIIMIMIIIMIVFKEGPTRDSSFQCGPRKNLNKLI